MAKSSAVVALSTMKPAYMTLMRWVMPATTPRSWVMRMAAVPVSSVRRLRSSRTWAWMVTSSAVVGSSAMSSLGAQGERHGDHHALAHAARELVGIGLEAGLRLGHADRSEQLDGLLACLVLGDLAVSLDGLDHLLLDGQHRVEAGHRVLEDHGDLATAQVAHLGLAVGQQVLPVEADAAALDAPGRLGQQAHEGQAGDALAAAGFADDAERLAFVELEGHAVDGVDGALVRSEANDEILDAEQGHLPVTA